MRKWLLRDAGGRAELVLETTAPVPEPGAGEVRVKVNAVSLNYRDQLVRMGAWGPTDGLVPISDGAGVVDALGEGVTAWSVGDRVVTRYANGWDEGPRPADAGFGLGSPPDGDGVLAEYAVLKADRIAATPPHLTDAEAATLPCAAVTAWGALFAEHPVLVGQRVLILGTGGVSMFALQFAAAVGLETIVTSSQDWKIRRCLELGARDGVNYRDAANWGQVVFEKFGGVHKVVNNAGEGSLDQAIEALVPGGDVALIGLTEQAEKPVGLFALMVKTASVRGVASGRLRDYEALSPFMTEHDIHPEIGRTFRFDQAEAAYDAAGGTDLLGKIVITVAD